MSKNTKDNGKNWNRYRTEMANCLGASQGSYEELDRRPEGMIRQLDEAQQKWLNVHEIRSVVQTKG